MRIISFMVIILGANLAMADCNIGLEHKYFTGHPIHCAHGKKMKVQAPTETAECMEVFVRGKLQGIRKWVQSGSGYNLPLNAVKAMIAGMVNKDPTLEEVIHQINGRIIKKLLSPSMELGDQLTADQKNGLGHSFDAKAYYVVMNRKPSNSERRLVINCPIKLQSV